MNKVITKIRSGIGGYLKDNILFLTFVFASVLNGFLLRAFTVKFNYSQIKPLMADFAVILLLALISYVFKKPRKQFVYLLILTIIFSILCTANSIYYTNYKSFISVSLISTASQLGGVMDAVTENIMEPKDLIFLWDIPAIIVVYILLKRRTRDYITEVKEKRKRRGYALGTFCVSIGLAGIFCSTLTGTDYSRLAKQWNREYVLGTFGLYTYQFSDVISCTHAKINMMFGYEESEEVFNKFYDDKSKTEETSEKSNKYTNIFKGKNIIVIHAESFQQFCMDTYINGRAGHAQGADGAPWPLSLNSHGFDAEDGAFAFRGLRRSVLLKIEIDDDHYHQGDRNRDDGQKQRHHHMKTAFSLFHPAGYRYRLRASMYILFHLVPRFLFQSDIQKVLTCSTFPSVVIVRPLLI